jgi:hypothetical protein
MIRLKRKELRKKKHHEKKELQKEIEKEIESIKIIEQHGVPTEPL